MSWGRDRQEGAIAGGIAASIRADLNRIIDIQLMINDYDSLNARTTGMPTTMTLETLKQLLRQRLSGRRKR